MNLYNNLINIFRGNKIFLSFSSLLNIVSVSLGGFVSFLLITLLAKTVAYVLNFSSSFNFGLIDLQISILGAVLQLSILLLKKAEKNI